MTSRRLLSPVSVALLNAADYIEEHGWCQGDMYDSDGRACAVGALTQVTKDLSARLDAEGPLREFVGTFVPLWNDAPGRTKAEVVSAMRAAALALTSTK